MIKLDADTLPRPVSEIKDLLRSAGVDFGLHAGYLIFEDDLQTGRINLVRDTLANAGINPRIRHSIWPTFDDADYASSPLWGVYCSDIWIREIDFRETCPECNTERIRMRSDVQVDRVRSNRAIASVNGQFPIVHRDLRSEIESTLTGFRFSPFDRSGMYFYLSSRSAFGKLIIRDAEVIDYQEDCSLCGFPKFRMYFGPLRYSRHEWNGEDVMWSPFRDGLVYSPRAFEVFKGFERKVSKGGIVMLE